VAHNNKVYVQIHLDTEEGSLILWDIEIEKTGKLWNLAIEKENSTKEFYSEIERINKKYDDELKALNTTTEQINTSPEAPESGIENFTKTKLYADSISNGAFNNITENPNDDTVFELEITSSTQANITIPPSAYERVLKRPSFLDWTDKQVLVGSKEVIVDEIGKAEKWADGKWRVTKKPSVILK
jgi:hypothetical protein